MVALRMKCILCDSVEGNLLSSIIPLSQKDLNFSIDLALLSYRIMGPGPLDKA